MTYIVYKREKCGNCKGTRINPLVMTPESWVAVENHELIIPVRVSNQEPLSCPYCKNGYIETPCDLLEVLGKLRWMATDGTTLGFIPSPQKFQDLRIEESESDS